MAEQESTHVGRTKYTKKRLRAHVDYQGMSVSYGRVKLGVPSGFKEMLEIVTREILREQPRNIPGFLAAYFNTLDVNQRKGCPLGSLVTERIVEEAPKTADAAVQEDLPRAVKSAVCEVQTEPKEEAQIETQTVEENTCKTPSHTSVDSISQLPEQFKMINCEVILKKSAEEIAVESNDATVGMSLEEAEKVAHENGDVVQQEEEEIVEEDEPVEPVETEEQKWAKQAQGYVPEDAEEVEQEQLAAPEAAGQSLEQQDHDHAQYEELEQQESAAVEEEPAAAEADACCEQEKQEECCDEAAEGCQEEKVCSLEEPADASCGKQEETSEQ